MGTCEYGNEPLGSIEGNKSHDYLSDYLFPSQEWLCSTALVSSYARWAGHKTHMM